MPEAKGRFQEPIDHVLYFIDNSGQKVHRYDRRLAASWDMVEQLPESFWDESSKATPGKASQWSFGVRT